MSNGGAVAAAAVAAKRKRIYSTFREGNATSVSTAKTLKELSLSESLIFHSLVRRGEVVKVDGDRYYLDESAVVAGRKKRVVLIAAIVLAALIVWILIRVL